MNPIPINDMYSDNSINTEIRNSVYILLKLDKKYPIKPYN